MPNKAHQLKCSTTFFPAIWDRSKPFEVRKNDRDYEEGDVLLLDEYDPVHGHTRRVALRKVTYLLTHEMFPGGVPPGYVVMGLAYIANMTDKDVPPMVNPVANPLAAP